MTGARRVRAPRGSGDLLREQIIGATRDLLAELGSSDAVSIRKVADRVGVTPPSIYLHFTDKWALLEEVVGSVFAELDAAMMTAAEGIEDPLARLCEYGLSYVDFAVAHPEHYRLATMERHPEFDEMSNLDRMIADSAFSHMLDAVSACMDAGIYLKADPLPLTLHLWAAAHGVASLMIAKPFLPWGDRRAFVNRALGSAAMGHAVFDVHGGDMDVYEGRAWIGEQWEQR